MTIGKGANCTIMAGYCVMRDEQNRQRPMTSAERVILVDEQDREIGTEEKQAAHAKALCHRAFSVFIFRQIEGEPALLLQQRNPEKYHCGGLWTNTCCSHPRPGEEIITAGQRRLREEMGIDTTLFYVDKFHYIAKFDNGLTENEVDHVLVGSIDYDDFELNPEEASDCRWQHPDKVLQDIQANPNAYTPWFKQALQLVLDKGALATLFA